MASLVSATALTYRLAANEKACFFAYVEEKGAKIAFYFAVRFAAPPFLPTYTTLDVRSSRYEDI